MGSITGQKQRITKRVVEVLKPGQTVWDTDAIGFGVRRQTKAKVYVFKGRIHGQQRWFTIGKHGQANKDGQPWNPERARRRARAIAGQIADGRNPASERDALKDDILVSELCDIYIEAAERGEIVTKIGRPKTKATLATDKGRIERHIKPLIGKKVARGLTVSDIKKLQADIAVGKTKADVKTRKQGRAIVTGGKGTASRTVGLLGGILTFGVEKGALDSNPVHAITRYKDQMRERFLTGEELARIGQEIQTALEAGANPYAVAALRLLILTGKRKSEVLGLTDAQVDIHFGFFRLPDGKGGHRTTPIGAPALEVLVNIPRVAGNPYYIVGSKPGSHLDDVGPHWRKIRKRAGIEDVTVHDLRHAFASVGVNSKESLMIVGALLGHRDPKTTQRYAHLADDPVRDAADSISRKIEAAMSGKSGEVVKLNRRT